MVLPKYRIQQLQILESPQGTRHVNVDSMSAEGLVRARRLELAESGIPEVMYTQLVAEATTVFSQKNHGRLFAVFRDPLERAVSMYKQAQKLSPQIASMSLSVYASARMPDNEVTRALVNKRKFQSLREEDLLFAMEILRRKCVVGLSDRISESMARFHKYFGWNSLVVGSAAQCEKDLLVHNERLQLPEEDSDAYNNIMAKNNFDVRLYEYARFLFDFQGGNTKDAR